MATHVSGIAITIKAFLPTGKTLDDQFTALSLVKEAHASGDYSAVLKAAKIDEVKAEQKTRRMEEESGPFVSGGTTEKPTEQTEPLKNTDGEKTGASTDQSGIKAEFDKVEPAGDIDAVQSNEEPDPRPDFLKKGKRSAE